MHFFSQDRLTIGTLPAFCPFGAPLGVIPDLSISPQPDGTMIVSAWFCTSRSRASRKHLVLTPGDFLPFYSRWLSDPEEVAKNEFGWTAETPPPATSQPISGPKKAFLSDLDF